MDEQIKPAVIITPAPPPGTQSVTRVEQPTGSVTVAQGTTDMPTWWKELGSWGRSFMQFGFAGAFLWLYFDDRRYERDQREVEAALSRTEHKAAFKEMRTDNKEGMLHDAEQRKKTNTILREQTKSLEKQTGVLESMEKTQLKLYDAILKKMP